MGDRGTRLVALAIPALLGSYLVATSSVELLPQAGVFDGKRLLQMAVFPLCLALGLVNAPIRANCAALLDATPRWALAAAFVAATVGIISGSSHPEFAYSVADVTLLLTLVAVIYVVAASHRVSPHTFDRLALGLIVAMGLIVVLQESLGMLASKAAGGVFGFDTMLLHFHHPRFFNQLQTWTIPLLAAIPFLFRGKQKYLTVLAIFLAALQWVLVFASGGRGTALSVIVSLLIVGLVVAKQRPRWLFIHAAALVAGTLIYAALLSPWSNPQAGDSAGAFQSRADRSLTQLTGRNYLWSIALEQSMEHPLQGIGPARYACMVPPGSVAHPHNLPLQLASEWGWPATLLICAVILSVGWRLLGKLHSRRPTATADANLAQLLGVSVLAAGLHSGLSGLLIMPASLVAAALIGGWCLGVLQPATAGLQADQPRAPAKQAWPRGGIVFLSVAFLMASSLLAWSSIEYARLTADGGFPSATVTPVPRFWSDGNPCGY